MFFTVHIDAFTCEYLSPNDGYVIIDSIKDIMLSSPFAVHVSCGTLRNGILMQQRRFIYRYPE